MITVYCPTCGAPVLVPMSINQVHVSGGRLTIAWKVSEVEHSCVLPPDPTQDKPPSFPPGNAAFHRLPEDKARGILR